MTERFSDLAKAQMETEIAELRAFADANPGDASFAASLMMQQASDRADALGRDIEGLSSEVFELAFAEKEAPAKHSLSTTVLVNLLGRFQRAITFAGWARLAGPGVSGNPPALVSRAFETEVNAFAPGSFAIELTPYEQALEYDALEGALEDFLALADVGAGEDSPQLSDELADVIQSLGAESARRFALFFAKVHEARLEARFEWHGQPELAVVLQPEQAKVVSDWLKHVDEEFESISVAGTLTAADIDDGRFAITDELGERHEGRAAPELLSHAVIEGRYVAQMRVRTLTSTVTSVQRTHSVLEALEPLGD